MCVMWLAKLVPTLTRQPVHLAAKCSSQDEAKRTVGAQCIPCQAQPMQGAASEQHHQSLKISAYDIPWPIRNRINMDKPW